MSENKELPKEERIGYHKGSIATLLAERNELLRLVQITENLVQAHISELEKLGVKLDISTSQGKEGKVN